MSSSLENLATLYLMRSICKVSAVCQALILAVLYFYRWQLTELRTKLRDKAGPPGTDYQCRTTNGGA